MSQHTPGPWRVIRHQMRVALSGQQPEEVWAVVASNANGPDGVFLGSVGTQPETEANARLIAAAPDLLAALEAINAWCADPQVWDFHHEPPWAKQMYDAMAKAKGER